MTKNDSLEIFTHALRFDYSADVLMDYMRNQSRNSSGAIKKWECDEFADWVLTAFPPTMIPAFVCEAFCIELFLKAILTLDEISYRKTHELDKLFEKLPKAWKDEVSRVFAAAVSENRYENTRTLTGFPESVEECLAQAAKAFQEWRYHFEYKSPTHFLFLARQAIYNSIITFKPEWESVKRNLETLPMHPGHSETKPTE